MLDKDTVKTLTIQTLGADYVASYTTQEKQGVPVFEEYRAISPISEKGNSWRLTIRLEREDDTKASK